MNSILAASFFLFLLCRDVSADKGFFKRNIFRELEDKNGQFSSEIEYILPIANRTVSVQEKYGFELKTGWLNRTETYERVSSDPLSVMYIYSQSPNSNVTRLYEYYSYAKDCSSRVYPQARLAHYLADWAPSLVFSSKFNFTVLGKLRRFLT